jgi:MscS family membrane protein
MSQQMNRRLMARILWIGWMAVFALGASWAVWTTAVAQTPADGSAGTAAAAAPAGTNTVSQLAQKVVGRDFVTSHQAGLSFGLNQVEALQGRFLGNPLWQYLATLIYLGLAFAVSKLLDYLVRTRLQAWAERTPNQWDDLVVRLVDGPVKVVSFVVLLNVGLQLFDWPAAVEDYLSRGMLIAVAFSVVYVLLRTIDAAMGLWKGRLKDDGDRAFNVQFVDLVGKGAKVVLCIVALLTLLQNLGVNITAILGSVSVLGLALGLAAQDTVANLFGAVAVFMDRPFKVGDRIRVGSDVDGTVEEIGLRATRVRTLDGFLVTVPNKSVGNNTVTNITARPTVRVILDYGLTYDTPASRVREASRILEEIFRGHPKTSDLNVHFNRFGDFHLNLNVVWICGATEWKEWTAILQDLQLQVKERFDAEKLEFAFPTRTVHVKTSQA